MILFILFVFEISFYFLFQKIKFLLDLIRRLETKQRGNQHNDENHKESNLKKHFKKNW